MSMERMTFTVPGPLKKRARKRRDVNWSAVVAQAIERKLDEVQRAEDLAEADRIAAKSKLTPKDVDEIAAMIDDAMARRLGLKK